VNIFLSILRCAAPFSKFKIQKSTLCLFSVSKITNHCRLVNKCKMERGSNGFSNAD
jgi:hypothetical protein